ncbi:unnamed protein product [Orchesella dallaii]|uniref:Uncharacterized protein n=1 Tax=Orchesella dallaii TaxID=48710 RepID=A0ABP1R724_9HEXA
MELNLNKKLYFCTSPCSKTQSAHAVLQISDPLKNKIAAMGRINPVSILYPRTGPSPPSPTLKSNGFTLFHWYFLLAYYVLYVPFKPVKHQSGKVTLKISKVQKKIVMIYMIFMHISMITVSILMFLFYGTSVGGPTILPSEQLNEAIKLAILEIKLEYYFKLGRFREWLSTREAREHIFVNRNELELLERRLDIGEIGIGAAGFFQVNYRLVSELVVFTVTIFLITFDDRTAKLIGNSCPCSVKPTL